MIPVGGGGVGVGGTEATSLLSGSWLGDEAQLHTGL